MPTNNPFKDAAFIKAPMDQKIAYLSSIDPAYAKAPKDEQVKYITDTLNPSSVPQPESTYRRLTEPYNPNVEEWAAKHPILGPAARFLDATGAAVMASPEQALRMFEQFGNPVKSYLQGEADLVNAVNAWRNPRAAASVLPEALGAGTGNVAAGEAAGEVPRIAREALPEGVRAPVARAMREGEGTGALKRPVRAVATAAGAGVGAYRLFKGDPYGAFESLLGGEYGPRIADRFVPKLEPKPEAAAPKSDTAHEEPGEAQGRMVLSPSEAAIEDRQRARVAQEASERGMMNAAGQKPGKAPRFVLPSQTIAAPSDYMSPEDFARIQSGARAPIPARIAAPNTSIAAPSSVAPPTGPRRVLIPPPDWQAGMRQDEEERPF